MNSLIQLLFSWDGLGADACAVQYSVYLNEFALVNDTASGYYGPYSAGSNNAPSNHQCTLYLAQTSVAVNGTTITLSLSIGFNSTFVGSLLPTVAVTDDVGIFVDSTFPPYVAYQLASGSPQVTSMPLPGAGFGTLLNLTLQATDPNGAKYIRAAAIDFANSAVDVACSVIYLPGALLFEILDSNNNSTIGSGPCLLNAPAPTISRSGNNFTMSGISVNITNQLPQNDSSAYTLTGSGTIIGGVSDASSLLAQGGGGWWYGNAQTITFGALNNVAYGHAPFGVSATATSGLPVSFTATPAGVCSVSGSTVTISGVGMCSITANQAGNVSAINVGYAAAPGVTQSFNVTGTLVTEYIRVGGSVIAVEHSSH